MNKPTEEQLGEKLAQAYAAFGTLFSEMGVWDECPQVLKVLDYFGEAEESFDPEWKLLLPEAEAIVKAMKKEIAP